MNTRSIQLMDFYLIIWKMQKLAFCIIDQFDYTDDFDAALIQAIRIRQRSIAKSLASALSMNSIESSSS